MLFFVCGIAFLTPIINATTAPAFVNWLGLTKLPEAQRRLMKMMYEQLANWSQEASQPPEVTHGLQHMRQDMEQNIERESHAPYVAEPGGVAEEPEGILQRLREAEARY